MSGKELYPSSGTGAEPPSSSLTSKCVQQNPLSGLQIQYCDFLDVKKRQNISFRLICGLIGVSWWLLLLQKPLRLFEEVFFNLISSGLNQNHVASRSSSFILGCRVLLGVIIMLVWLFQQLFFLKKKNLFSLHMSWFAKQRRHFANEVTDWKCPEFIPHWRDWGAFSFSSASDSVL